MANATIAHFKIWLSGKKNYTAKLLPDSNNYESIEPPTLFLHNVGGSLFSLGH